ncbi:hypothetical protein FNV43_RR02211 [Rhamnella rubrinervis]|uniref:Uncharacterized protein n=1 Tax=Rhamnella rubrinervis TaxID=2594499 RepID=A0A8K0MTL9_9ROSA|nr:hypothetical protein FNV43_RR02211 [Rhamnella rubrinervis]
MLACRKHLTVQLVKRLEYSNLLGLDVNLKSGSNLPLFFKVFQNVVSLSAKSLIDDLAKPKFPREVLLCRVGDFYEALGIDACILVEYRGLNPFGVMQRQKGVTLIWDLNSRQSMGHLIDERHAHHGRPSVFGHVGVDHDLHFPEQMPVIGMARIPVVIKSCFGRDHTEFHIHVI